MRASIRRLAAALLVCAAVLLTPAGRALAAAEPADDAALWRAEYEALNGQKSASGRLYPTVTVPEGLAVSFPTEDEVLGLFEDGTGVLYFGFPECPWCRTLLPVLAEVLTAHPSVRLYCYDLRADRDEYQTGEDGEPRQTRAGTAFYGALLALLDEWLGPYEGLNDDALKRIYMPTLVFLKDGAVLSVHIGTADGQKSGYDPLTDAQRAELKTILEEAVGPLSPHAKVPVHPLCIQPQSGKIKK